MSGALASGCSASHSHPAPSAAKRTTAVPSSDPAAARLVAGGITATKAVRSYAFAVTETVAAKRSVSTRINGRAVRGQGVAYVLATGTTRTQVVRLHGTTYVRHVPGRWTTLHRPGPLTDPTGTLVGVLGNLVGVTASGRTVEGALPPRAATDVHIPTDGQPANVSVTFDPLGRVTKLDVTTSTAVGTRAVTLTAVTTYGDFNRAPAVRRPPHRG